MDHVSVVGYANNLALSQKDAILIGIADEGGVTLLGCAYCAPIAAELQEVTDVLPAPLVLLGAFAQSKEEALKSASQVLKAGFCSQGCIAINISGEKLQASRVKLDGTVGHDLNIERIPSFDEWLKRHRILRCELPIVLELLEDGTVPFTVALQSAFDRVLGQLDVPELAFLTDPGPAGKLGPVLLRADADGLVESLPGSSGSGSSNGGGADVVRCSPLIDTTQLASPPNGLMFTYRSLAAATGGSGGAATCRTETLRLDVLSYVRRNCSLGAAVAALSRGIIRQLHAAQRVLEKLNGQVLLVRAHHFLPPGLSHHLTVLYPTLLDDPERNDDRLVAARQRLHALMGLPLNRPLLRSANAVDMAVQGEDGGGGGAVARLQDVHVGLAAPGIGGTSVLVQGSYEYCHYMQDRFNDAGWGCAYRSLQTICSWFRLQKYTSKPIPSHRTIQQVLVRLGDKPPTFVGSCNWIGAIELSYILDDYLGVTSKILTVNRGADIPSHARELAAHFATVGSPVMIGGGVLAYTLLGVRFNEQTGEAAFLILDPHFTGGEDLRKIQQGAWVGWKRPGDNAAAGGPLFVEDAFYNFLLPQRPNTV
ncbi:hypothetical protein Vretifemale_14951 [Volvox reticuliferus]|uniref:Ufm1-specific protease n=1 Tax=Volvox reticuliferus TaxID=1737510 RepID=A0A8J4FUN9_9CHLO|nr:hypothetical protein Vretifemale_14951 [Volvox reticuliferus]